MISPKLFYSCLVVLLTFLPSSFAAIVEKDPNANANLETLLEDGSWPVKEERTLPPIAFIHPRPSNTGIECQLTSTDPALVIVMVAKSQKSGGTIEFLNSKRKPIGKEKITGTGLIALTTPKLREKYLSMVSKNDDGTVYDTATCK